MCPRDLGQASLLPELLRRDPASEQLADFLLQRYGYSPRGERSDGELAAEIRTRHDALSQAYDVPLGNRPLPNAEKLEEIRQGFLSDLASGDPWRFPDEVALLACLDHDHPAFLASIRHALATQPIPETFDTNTLATLGDHIIKIWWGGPSREEQ